jgi:hypothetical protein
MDLCVASTTSSLLGGSCVSQWPSPTKFAWHHYIIRYDGTGTAAGQGAQTIDVYLDGGATPVASTPNDAAMNPVFNAGLYDPLGIGAGGVLMDDIKIFNQVFTPQQQCQLIIGGAWTGTSCTLP